MASAETLFQNLSAEITRGMQRLPIPGLAVGVWHAGIEQAAGFGVTSVENPLPVTPDTLFQVGSISKTFTATALMMLREAGKVDLDTPLRTYLPNFRLSDEDVAARATIKHLLTHTGGWLGDYFNDFGFGDDAQVKMLNEIAKLPQFTPLGEVWSYCNTGFNIAGRIIEVITGQTYEAAIKEMILDPLGMNMTFYFPHEVMTYRFAVGHEISDRAAKVARPWPIGRAGHPVGGIVSTVIDLLKYARFHLGNGSGLLKPESIKLMQTPIVTGSGLDVFGLSWFITPIGDTPILRHGGATHGFTADFTLVPSQQFAITTLTNSDEGPVLYNDLRVSAIKQYLDVAWPETPEIQLSPAQLLAYTGVYDASEERRELYLQDGVLMLQSVPKGGFPTPDSPPHGEPPPPTRLAFWGIDKIIALDDPFKGARGEFLRKSDGTIAWFRFGSRVHRPL
ncbi:MAG TPA: serine hydrolase domain-containing protein [Anaerolineae bacterium]|nr:serine hydrolase domain-containing protein [Anaerolineae bacterium]